MKGNSISHFKSPKSSLVNAHISICSLFSENRKAQAPMPHTEHLFLNPFSLLLMSQCLKQNMKLAALFIIPQLNFALFSVCILVGDQTDELLGCWDLGNLGTLSEEFRALL